MTLGFNFWGTLLLVAGSAVAVTTQIVRNVLAWRVRSCPRELVRMFSSGVSSTGSRAGKRGPVLRFTGRPEQTLESFLSTSAKSPLWTVPEHSSTPCTDSVTRLQLTLRQTRMDEVDETLPQRPRRVS